MEVTRKKFVKLAMSKGISRNDAARLAPIVIGMYSNYETAYVAMISWRRPIGYVPHIQSTLCMLREVAYSVTDAFRGAAAALSDFCDVVWSSLQNQNAKGERENENTDYQ